MSLMEPSNDNAKVAVLAAGYIITHLTQRGVWGDNVSPEHPFPPPNLPARHHLHKVGNHALFGRMEEDDRKVLFFMAQKMAKRKAV